MTLFCTLCLEIGPDLLMMKPGETFSGVYTRTRLPSLNSHFYIRLYVIPQGSESPIRSTP